MGTTDQHLFELRQSAEKLSLLILALENLATELGTIARDVPDFENRSATARAQARTTLKRIQRGDLMIIDEVAVAAEPADDIQRRFNELRRKIGQSGN